MFSTETVSIISNLARREGLKDAALLAVAEVESGGVPYWNVEGRRLPPIRFEGHYFYRLLPPGKRERAVAAGLASPRAGAVKNPRSYAGRYDLFARARAIDEDAAIESCSWGLGQVMGAHWRKLGFSNPRHLMETAAENVAGQVELMLRFIRANKLTRHIKALDWHAFARAYNGPAYRKNRYAAKMAAAYKRWLSARNSNDRSATTSLVYEVQEKLTALGYDTGPLDGVQGTSTTGALKQFQHDSDLVVDGLIGPMTLDALDDAMEARKKAAKEGDRKKVKARYDNGLLGMGGVSGALVTLITTQQTWLIVAAVILVLIGIGFIIYNRRDKDDVDTDENYGPAEEVASP